MTIALTLVLVGTVSYFTIGGGLPISLPPFREGPSVVTGKHTSGGDMSEVLALVARFMRDAFFEYLDASSGQPPSH